MHAINEMGKKSKALKDDVIKWHEINRIKLKNGVALFAMPQ